ncbi:MarR family winged helix-turn-helix transcriptional regulator [Nocardioides donggukensis]|uniref:MarR family transcriptional regulator n=1 Tax=Nocardioides donggukensis TaxID=2774019 RepID=A0A927K2E8_9ACTN|nr:MarR family transcriptional regulator [Nocardioides donggukensis]MBD8868218.1 MarR family transcriptional regulator [Nocardioides donggukensis]
MADQDPTPDHVSRIMAQWQRERPDLDVSPMAVIGRLHRLAAALDAELRTVFAAEGLSDGEFDLLATLRRAGDPFELTPGEIAASTMVTSGAVTKRVDRLARAGLVARAPSASDGRSRRVRLTAEGRTLVDRVLERHLANERRLLLGLDGRQRAQLARLLEEWGRALGV